MKKIIILSAEELASFFGNTKTFSKSDYKQIKVNGVQF